MTDKEAVTEMKKEEAILAKIRDLRKENNRKRGNARGNPVRKRIKLDEDENESMAEVIPDSDGESEQQAIRKQQSEMASCVGKGQKRQRMMTDFVKADIVINRGKSDTLAEVIPNDGISVVSVLDAVLDGTVDEVTPDVRIRGLTMKANTIISTEKNDELAEVIPDDGISALSVLDGTGTVDENMPWEGNDVLVKVTQDSKKGRLAEVSKTVLPESGKLYGSDELSGFDELSGLEVRRLSQVTKTDAMDEDALYCNVSNITIANNLYEGMAEDIQDCFVKVEEVRCRNELSGTTSGSGQPGLAEVILDSGGSARDEISKAQQRKEEGGVTRDRGGGGRDEICQEIVAREMSQAYIGKVLQVRNESMVVGIPDCEDKEDEKVEPRCDEKEKINGQEMIKANYSAREIVRKF